MWVINKKHHRSSSTPSSLPVCPSPPSTPFCAQNKSERTRLAEKTAETIGNSCSSCFGFLPLKRCAASCEKQVNDLWTRPFHSGPKFLPAVNVANRDLRRSVFHLKVGLRSWRAGRQSRRISDFQLGSFGWIDNYLFISFLSVIILSVFFKKKYFS